MYFWSDMHFNHNAIINYCTRPFDTVDDMNRHMMEVWNDTLRDDDEIYVIGDFAFVRKDTWDISTIFYTLRGRKHLIIGNHDRQNKSVLHLPWESQHDLLEIKQHGQKMQLCHYPLESWKGKEQGAIHLHGHTHGTMAHKIPRRYEVGVDVEPCPVRWDELVTRASKDGYEERQR